MCVSTINGETHNHTIQEKEPTKQQDIFAMDDSAVILKTIDMRPVGWVGVFVIRI